MTLPDHALCRSSYYTDTGRRQEPGEREVRCGRGDGHVSNVHQELNTAGEVIAEWPRRPREPRTWTLPPEPGPEVKAVRDQDGNRWDRDVEGGWRFADTTVAGVKGVRIVWSGLVSQFGPLSEVVDAP